jgi:hypothetical protein
MRVAAKGPGEAGVTAVTLTKEQQSPNQRKWWRMVRPRKVYGNHDGKAKSLGTGPPSHLTTTTAESTAMNCESHNKADITLIQSDIDISCPEPLPQSSLWDDCLRSFSQSDDEEGDQISDDGSENLTRLQKKFECRKERLRRLCNGRPLSYIKMLEAHEEAVHQVVVAHCTNQFGQNHENRQTERRKPTFLQQSWWAVLFELNHTLPASYQVLLVCMGHATFFAFFDVVMKSLYYSLIANDMATSLSIHAYHALEIILGLVLIRINGNIFYWQDDTSSYLGNVEMRNRLKLNWLDAIALKRLKGSILGSAFTMFGFYLVYMGLTHFYYSAFLCLYNIFYTWYESVSKQADLAVRANATIFATETNSTDIDVSVSPSCTVLVEHLAPGICYPEDDWLGMDNPSEAYYYKLYDYFYRFYQVMQQWLAQQLCMDTTYEWRILSLVYHGFWIALVATLIAINGDNILRYCDD